MGNEEVLPDWLAVSRETLDDLRAFRRLVEKWNPAVNLVSKTDVDHLWARHIIDSAQIFALAPVESLLWCDLGSGGGFPGLVAAIMSKHDSPSRTFVLVESDRRKAVFLKEVTRLLNLQVEVRAVRIEDLEPQGADVLSARALAPLSALCGHARRHVKSGGVAIFPKGVSAAEEVSAARREWSFELAQYPSRTEATASVLLLRDIQHV